MDQSHCEKLLEEYQALRRRLEEIDFANSNLDSEDDRRVDQTDIDRLEELEEKLNNDCDVELPDETEDDIDLPGYATGSPSEPRDDINE